jgi:putative hemolysin
VDEPPSYTILLTIFSEQGLADPLIIAVGVLLLLITVLISASEAAFFSLRAEELDRCRQSTNRNEQAIVALLDSPHILLVTIILLNSIAKVGIVTISTLLMWDMSSSERPVGIVIFSTAIAIIFFGELLPKIYAKNDLGFARTMAGTWKILVALCKPVSITLMKVRGIWTRKAVEKRTTAEELSQALEIAAGIEGTSEGEKDILRGIVNFGTLTVKQVMRTHTEISALNVESNFDELLDAVNKSGFSRIPVYRRTIDTIEGVLYIKDLLPFLERDSSFDWQRLLRPGFFVPETKKIDLLLKDFQEKRVHMALVADEFGGTAGLVTLEDLIEEIIGEINDEFDEVDIAFKRIDDRTFVFDGKTSLHDFCKAVDLDLGALSAVRGESESLGGLILELNNELPKAGDQISFEQFTFVIESVDRKRIKRVRVKIHEQA